MQYWVISTNQRLGMYYRCLSLNPSMKRAADYWPFLRTTDYSLLGSKCESPPPPQLASV